jgi:tetratricopeptide (TPR) repeat protein
MRLLALWLACLFCSGLPASALAQTVRDDAIRAEMAGDWNTAVQIYRGALDTSPDDADLWERLGDVYGRLEQPAQAADAFARAARLRPDVAAYHVKTSQAYAVIGDYEKALEAIGRAAELEPNNTDYLLARAQLANAAGVPATAAAAYERLLELQGPSQELHLAYARALLWSGELDEAAEAYEQYVTRYDATPEIRIDAARVELWRGDYVRALDILDEYVESYGSTDDELRLRGRVLARDNRTDEALSILAPLRQDTPDDFDVQYSRTIAFRNGRRPVESLEALEHMEELGGDSPEMVDVRRFVKTPLRSYVTVGGEYYRDEDDIGIWRVATEGWYAVSPTLFVGSGGGYTELRAPRGSGLERADGGREAAYWDAWGGARYRHSDQWAADLKLGYGETEGHDEFLYEVGIDYTPADHMAFRLQQDRLFHLVSPRTASLGIHLNRTSGRAYYEFDDRVDVIDVQASYGDFSDGNDRWEVGIAPRRKMLRREHYNLDIGVRALLFGFDEDLANGYYDPKLYQSYMVTTFHYWKINDDDGVSVTLAAGVSRDDRTHFDFAADATVEGTFGLYRDWMLVVRASGTHTNQSARGFDDFYAARVGVFLTRRF